MTKDKRSSFKTTTDVTFAELTRAEVEFYVENYQPLDKAGAYGIQEWIGCVAVKGINGSFYNVMGLPVHQLYNELKKF
jgi:septum formation protein